MIIFKTETKIRFELGILTYFNLILLNMKPYKYVKCRIYVAL